MTKATISIPMFAIHYVEPNRVAFGQTFASP